MQKKLLLLSLCASLMADSDMEKLKKDLKEQQELSKELVSHIKALELNAQKNTNTSASFSQKEYLPDIALILNMSALYRDVDNSSYENYAVPGFVSSGEAELPFNKNRGFNLNYAELAFHSDVDPYFEAFAYMHVHPDDIELDEAYVNTTALPLGFRIKAGKFKSAFGRLNEKHQHSWNFDEQALVYKSFFGPDAISDPGIQVQWVAPTDTYIMAGVEALQGTNDRSFGYKELPNLFVTYLKSSVDVGEDISVLGGVSFARGKTLTNQVSKVYGVDLTLRYQLGSYSSLIWQSEYLQRDKRLDSSSVDQQGGLYSELVYKYNMNYSLGCRYDNLIKNDTDLSSFTTNTDTLDRYSVMLEYKPFEMSRLRLNYSYDRSKVINNERKDINTLMLTLNIAAGAHGAHAY